MDFGQGVEEAITQTAAILGKPDEGKALLARYQKAVRKLEKATAGQKLGKRVVVLNGIYQAQTGKAFIQVQAPGGYIDKFILSPLGCMNVGKGLATAGQKPSKGCWTIRRLKGLAKIKPDVVVITGDPAAVQKELAMVMAKQPELCGLPVFSLPNFIGSSVIEQPAIVYKWFWALK